jgi:hypothetical protein
MQNLSAGHAVVAQIALFAIAHRSQLEVSCARSRK